MGFATSTPETFLPQSNGDTALPDTNGNGQPNGHAAINASVLVVDQDAAVVEVFTRAIQSLGIEVVSAADGRQALAAARRTPFNLWLVDVKLPDLHGLDVVQALRGSGHKTPFLVVSGSATVQTTVEAMKLGALTVLEKPVRLDVLRRVVGSAVETTALERLIIAEPHAPAERWCNYLINLITSKHDLKTDGPWAKYLGVSLSTLRDCCKRVDVSVEDARNFGRALRAIYRCGDQWTPETVLDIDDRRTLKRFEERSGVVRSPHDRGRGGPTPTLEEFFERQTWLPRDNPGVLACRALLMRNRLIAAPSWSGDSTCDTTL
jgi:ActR/RegA family two-component response regulator